MRLKILIPILIVVLGVLALIFWGRAPKPESGSMLKAWSESISKLGVRAVYPLQEGLYPGNILLVPTYPNKTRTDEKPSEFYSYYPIPAGSLDLCQLYLSLQNAPELPPVSGYVTKGAKPTADSSETPWQPTEIKYSNFKCVGNTGVDFKLNRAVAFPAFQFGSAIETGLGGNMIAWMVGANGGAAGKDESLITVTVPSATVLRVPMNAIQEAWNSGSFDTVNGWDKLQCVILQTMGPQTVRDNQGNSSKPDLLVVSEVYYANAIDVSITNSNAQSAELAVSTQALVEKFEQLTGLRDQLKALTTAAPAVPGNSTQVNTEANQNAVNDLARQISVKEAEIDKLSKAILPDAPGVTGAVKRVSTSGVTLTQVFPRPMAIGYRGLAYNTGDKLMCPQPKAEQEQEQEPKPKPEI